MKIDELEALEKNQGERGEWMDADKWEDEHLIGLRDDGLEYLVALRNAAPALFAEFHHLRAVVEAARKHLIWLARYNTVTGLSYEAWLEDVTRSTAELKRTLVEIGEMEWPKD